MSFGWTMMMRRGAWDEFRRFALLQRMNVPSRINQINKDLDKIGKITILYQKENPEDKFSRMIERRQGILVNEKSTLTKLLRAYIAQGGNPLDISMFLMPDSYKVIEGQMVETMPYGGVIYPESREDEDRFSSKIDTSGYLIFWRYPLRKVSDRGSPWANHAHTIGFRVDSARRWLPQEIKTLRNDLEARIIKLCDLREQLLIERDEILYQALGDAVPTLPDFDVESFSEEHHLFSIINFIDRAFYDTSEGFPNISNPRPGSPDNPYPTLLANAPNGEEDFTAIG